MRLHCNIDAKGKAIRLVYGLVLLSAGLAMMLFWAVPGRSMLAWAVSLLCLASGAFVIFESRAGWCVVRALGIKTRF